MLWVSIAIGTIVHFKKMQLAGFRQLLSIEFICCIENLGTLDQGAHKDVRHVNTLQQIALHLLGYMPKGLQIIKVMLQAINIILVQLSIVFLGVVHYLMIGHGKQLLKELVQRILETLTIQNDVVLVLILAFVIAVVRRVL